MKRFYKFHNLIIRVSSDLSEPLDIFEKIYGLHPAKTVRKADLNLNFFKKSKKLKINRSKKYPHRFKLIRERAIEGLHDGKKLYINDKQSFVEIDYSKKSATFILDKSTLKLGKLFTHNMLPLVMIELLKKYGFYYLHASCAEIDGKGVLFFGQPAKGKTTACYSLIRKGAKWISDDAVLLRKYGNKIFAHSFAKEFTIKAGPNALFPELVKLSKKKTQKSEIMKSLNLSVLFKKKTLPKVLFLVDSKNAKPFPKDSEIIGSIIRENEFLLLNKHYADKVIEGLTLLLKQCKVLYLKDKNFVLDSKKFYSRVSELAH